MMFKPYPLMNDIAEPLSPISSSNSFLDHTSKSLNRPKNLGDRDLPQALFPLHLLSSGSLVGQRQLELDR